MGEIIPSMNLKTQIESLESKEPFRENIVIPLWSLMVWLVVMNTTMFNVALPSILTEFRLSPDTGSLIVTGYSIVFAIATVTYSRLSDFIPIRRLLAIGLTLFGLSSVIGFFAEHFYVLLFARLLQAMGASAAPGLGMVLISRYVPVYRRGRAMSFVASSASLGFGLGPVIGGSVTQFLGWNFLFVITGFVMLLIPFFRRFLPKEKTEKANIDMVGGLYLGAGIASLLLFLKDFSYIFLGLCGMSLFLCWRHIHRVPDPFIQPALLRNQPFLLIIGMGFTAFFTHFATLFAIPIMLTALYGKGSAAIGLIIFPGAMLSALAAFVIGRMIDRFGNPMLIASGHILFILSTLLLCVLSGVSSWVVMAGYMFMSVGFSSLTSSLSNEISRILPEPEIGSGMGMAQLIQFFGGAFGVAVTGLLLVTWEELSPALIYQRIYLALSVLLSLSFLLFLRYLREKYGRVGFFRDRES